MGFSTGNILLDKVLNKGYKSKEINMIYGPAATGKTTCCLMVAIDKAKKNEKVLYLDTENGFSIERIKQIVKATNKKDYKEIIENIIVISIDTFEKQIKTFENLKEIVENGLIGLVIIDTMGKQYRKALREDHSAANNAMNKQMREIKNVLDKTSAEIVITNQVYADFKNEGEVEMVGGKMIRNWSDNIIELKKIDGKREIILATGEKTNFKIEQEGFVLR
jgi:DNA repair protein RadB